MARIATNALLLLAFPGLAAGFSLSATTVGCRALRCGARLQAAAMSTPDDMNDEQKTDAEGDELAAAFAARLAEEGGATQFKIKSGINDAKEGLISGVESAKRGVESVGDAASSSADGIRGASGVQLVGGLFAAVVLFTLVSAGLNSGPVDKYTSDGQTLEFGKRSMEREVPMSAYQPEYGRQ
eukprot:CAMPEP_0115862864 /NCGR_PEP_ID=MMETSP0287-20121206/18398_1 /TAXON_ID=412157 /ORGANISM="Chrysochromulina rotalis, Strain UIO044" /LENGTH=182 /DNA_ID=CAMNT_0003317303 /DNA_START=21 /DNA_END=569 /DNA_ORIENTATION=-